MFQHSKYTGTGPEKAGRCFPLCLDCRVADLISTVSEPDLPSPPCPALSPSVLASPWHANASSPRGSRLEAQHCTGMGGLKHLPVSCGFIAHGMTLMQFSETVVHDLRWCLLLLHWAWSSPGPSEAGWGAVAFGILALPGRSRRWDAGLAVCWCQPSLSPSAWGFFAVTVPLRTA